MSEEKKKKETINFTSIGSLLFGVGLGIGIYLCFWIFPPTMLQNAPYHLETEKEYIAFHVDTTDFPMVVIDQIIDVLEDNNVKAEAIVFVKNRKPVSQIRLPEMKTEDEETK